MAYKAIIIENKTESAMALKEMLAVHCPDLKVIKIFDDTRNALEYLLLNKPDLVFLNFQMPHLNGVELYKKFKNPEFQAIFTSQDDPCAIEAFIAEDLEYILKPFKPEKLQEVINRFIHKTALMKNKEESAQRKMTIINGNNNKLIVNLQNQILFLNTEDILYLEANSNYTKFHLADGKCHRASKTIKFFEAKINSAEFFRPHQSYLVNRKYIKAYSRADNCLILENDTTIPVSRNKKENLLRKMVN